MSFSLNVGKETNVAETGCFRADGTRDESLPKNLSGHAMSNGIVAATAQGIKFGLTLLGALVLGRLLTPQDFGLVGMVSTITAFLGIFSDFGLSTATVQAEKLTDQQSSNLFWINSGFGLIIGLFAVVLAPAVAWFYHDARLVSVTIALAFTFPLTGMALQHRALLNRRMKFRSLAIIEIGSMALSLLVGCLMAMLHYGYWALAGMQLSLALFGCGLTWLASRWHPTLPQREPGLAPLMSFGVDLTISGLVYNLSRACDTLLLGRFWGPTPVGLYSRASALLLRPVDQFLAPVSSVLMPILCRVKNQPERYRRVFLQAYDAVGLVCFPLSALFVASARPLILVLLGPAWSGAISLFAAFALMALYLPLAASAMWLFTSQARSREMLTANILLSSLTVISFVCGLPYGALGMVLAFSVSGLFIRLPLLYYLAGRRGAVGAKDLWRVFFRHLPVWASVYVFTTVARVTLHHRSSLFQLAICLAVGSATAVITICALDQQRQSVRFLVAALSNSLATDCAPCFGILARIAATKAWFRRQSEEGGFLPLGRAWVNLRSLYHFHSVDRFANALVVKWNVVLGRWTRIEVPDCVIHRRFHICKDKASHGMSVVKLPHAANEFSTNLIRTLKSATQYHRYREILKNVRLDPFLGTHCLDVSVFRPDGSYRSEYVEGINLGQLRAELFSSKKLPGRVQDDLIQAILHLLGDLTRYYESTGTLFGDWPLHNLVYSPARKVIVNVDAEGFFTYSNGSCEARFPFVRSNLLHLIDLLELTRSNNHDDLAIVDIFRAIDKVRHSGRQYSGLTFVTGYHSLELRGRKFRGQRDCAARLARVPIDFNNKVVLDLGCNVGGMLHCVSSKIRKGYGCDCDPNCINGAQAIKTFNGSANLEFFVFDLDRQPFSLLNSLLLQERVDICFLLSICRWLSNWQSVIQSVSQFSDMLLFEANGTEQQQRDQLACLRKHYRRVNLLSDTSDDDFSQPDRKLFLCAQGRSAEGLPQ
jgi:PST family polysaccharide transporter